MICEVLKVEFGDMETSYKTILLALHVLWSSISLLVKRSIKQRRPCHRFARRKS